MRAGCLTQDYKKLKYFVTLLLLISPLASSFTFQAPSALRSLSLVIPFSILSALGIYQLKNIKYIILIFYFVFFLYFLDSYFIHAPKRYPFAWNQGFMEIIPEVNRLKDNYSQVYFTSQYDQPYILYLFFSKYPPSLLHPQIKLTPKDKFGFSTVLQIDNIYFSIPTDIPINSLVIDSSDFTKTGSSFTIYTK